MKQTISLEKGSSDLLIEPADSRRLNMEICYEILSFVFLCNFEQTIIETTQSENSIYADSAKLCIHCAASFFFPYLYVRCI